MRPRFQAPRQAPENRRPSPPSTSAVILGVSRASGVGIRGAIGSLGSFLATSTCARPFCVAGAPNRRICHQFATTQRAWQPSSNSVETKMHGASAPEGGRATRSGARRYLPWHRLSCAVAKVPMRFFATCSRSSIRSPSPSRRRSPRHKLSPHTRCCRRLNGYSPACDASLAPRTTASKPAAPDAPGPFLFPYRPPDTQARNLASIIRTCAFTPTTRGSSRMRQYRSHGSVWGARGNPGPCRDR